MQERRTNALKPESAIRGIRPVLAIADDVLAALNVRYGVGSLSGHYLSERPESARLAPCGPSLRRSASVTDSGRLSLHPPRSVT